MRAIVVQLMPPDPLASYANDSGGENTSVNAVPPRHRKTRARPKERNQRRLTAYCTSPCCSNALGSLASSASS
jgi:hypothetical protein